MKDQSVALQPELNQNQVRIQIPSITPHCQTATRRFTILEASHGELQEAHSLAAAALEEARLRAAQELADAGAAALAAAEAADTAACNTQRVVRWRLRMWDYTEGACDGTVGESRRVG